MEMIMLAEGSSNSWIMLVVLGVLLVFMVLMSIIPQKKRRKAAQEMMSKLRTGDKIKTIGGFVATIHAVDNATNTLVVNLSDNADAPILVTIDRTAIYTVLNPNPATNMAEANAPQITPEVQEAKSLDDLEEETKIAEKKAEKAGKKKVVDVKPEEVKENPDDVKH